MIKGLKAALTIFRQDAEGGVSKTKVAALALLVVQLANLAGYNIPQEAVVEIILGVIAALGIYQKIERNTI